MLKCCLERRLIGEVLFERGLVTRAQLHKALAEQRSRARNEYLGEILVRMGAVSETDIVTALVLQCNLPFIAVSKYEIDSQVLKCVPADFARKNKLVPLERIGNILSVVMLNPLNEATREEVESMTGCTIATFISTRSEIEKAIERFYGKGS